MKKTHHKGERKGEMKIKNVPESDIENPCLFMHFNENWIPWVPFFTQLLNGTLILLLFLATWRGGL